MDPTSRSEREPRLKDKVAIVTGGGGYDGVLGTGRATAICMAREGAKVLVVDLNGENASRTAETIRDEIGGEASIFIADATKSKDCHAMVNAAVERFGGLHVLVNNLGFGGQTQSSSKISQGFGVAGLDEDELERVMDFNLKSAMLASKHAIPAMIAAGGGSIINFSSCDALAAAEHYRVPYSVSKGALHILTQTTAAWHGRDGIRANCIAPGHLHSAYTNQFSPDHRDLRRRVVPLGTEGTPWDVAWAAVFLASDEARWISGVILPVDGGLFAAQPLLGHNFITGEYPQNKTK